MSEQDSEFKKLAEKHGVDEIAAFEIKQYGFHEAKEFFERREEKLKEALRFYADDGAYEPQLGGEGEDVGDEPIFEDFGQKAKKVLEELDNES